MTLSPRLAQLGPPLMDATVTGLPLYSRGKVRDTFDFGDHLLMVATDRVSAFDVVLPNGIPDKGTILTQMSRWWFGRTSEICPNHLADGTWPPELPEYNPDWAPRSMYVRRADRIDIECVVRGYLAGSGWQEYGEQGTLAGLALPAGVGETDPPPGAPLPPPPQKDTAHHQENPIPRMADIGGPQL